MLSQVEARASEQVVDAVHTVVISILVLLGDPLLLYLVPNSPLSPLNLGLVDPLCCPKDVVFAGRVALISLELLLLLLF